MQTNQVRSPTKPLIEEDVWDDQIDGEPTTVEVDLPKEEPNIQNLPNKLAEIAQAKRDQVARVTQVLQPQPYLSGNQYQKPIPWIPLAMIGGGFGMATLLGITAIVASSLPNAQVSKQQELLSAVTMEVAKRPPENTVCLFAVHCPKSQAEAEGGAKENLELDGSNQPTEETVKSDNIGAITLYTDPSSLYERWFNYYATKPLDLIANDANRFDDKYCLRNPDRCAAMNDVKAKKVQLGG